MLVSLIISALGIVYAISFFSGTYDTYSYLSTSGMDALGFELINADPYFNAAQSYVDISVVLGIVLLLLVVLNYLTASNTRRNYYVTNYVSIAAVTVFAAVFVVYGLINLSNVVDLYVNGIKWDVYDALQKNENFLLLFGSIPKLSRTSPMFAVGYVVYAAVALVAVAFVLNLIWKVRLMQGEKELLKQGMLKEAA